jgi:hypothetical protein
MGLLLSMPLTVCFAVAGKHVPQLRFLTILLGDEPVFEPKTRVYQRLLAGDFEEATELAEGLLQAMPLVDVYDTVLIPALAMVERDRHRGELDESREELIWQGLADLTQEIGPLSATEGESVNDEKSGSVRNENKRLASIVCLPAHDMADEISSIMLRQLLELEGFSVCGVSASALANEKVALAVQQDANIICISAMPPAAAIHAKYLYKRIAAKIPHARIVVGLWDTISDLNKAQQRIGCGDDVRIVRTLCDAQTEIRRLAQSLPLMLSAVTESSEISDDSAVAR